MAPTVWKSMLGFFRFNRTERYGIVVVLTLIIVAILIPAMVPTPKQDYRLEEEQFMQDIKKFEAGIIPPTKDDQDAGIDYRELDKPSTTKKVQYFPFDPNQLQPDEWQSLGLRAWQIKVIMNYKAKGGKFRDKEDLKKMYCLKPEEYARLEPYINIPVNNTIEKSPYIKPPKSVNAEKLIELNTADTNELVELYGIGPAFARRICKYRDKLGGFYQVSQLLEVYGMKPETVDQLKSHVTVDASQIKKLNINSLTVKDLQKHPYFDYYISKAIVDRRIIKGNFTDVGQLKEIDLIHEDVYNRISPYISLK